MNHAFIFPGQGSQYIGMGAELIAEVKEATDIFARADQALGRSITKLIAEGPESDLALTWNTQPAILTVSVACLAALKARTGLVPIAVAGHSLGEYAALVAAGVLTFEDAVVTVEKRGSYMQEAVPVGVGAMYAILGLEAEAVEKICAEVSVGGRVVTLANDNCPGQLVISGHADAAEAAAKLMKEAGAKRAVQLNVSAPFHSPLMAPAAEKLRQDLAKITFSTPTCPVVCNVDAKAHTNAGDFADLLARQVASQVRWTECVRTLKGLGATTLLEIGPGKVLTGMVKRIEKELDAANLENLAGLNALAGA